MYIVYIFYAFHELFEAKIIRILERKIHFGTLINGSENKKKTQYADP